MFSDTEFENSLDHVLYELTKLEREILELETKTLNKALLGDDVKKEYRKKMDALTRKYQLKVEQALELYYSEISDNYLKDDIATYKKAYKEGVILVAPVISKASKKIVENAIKYDVDFFNGIVSQLKNNANKDVDALVKKYSKELSKMGKNPKTLRLKLAKDLYKLATEIESINGTKTYHDIVAYSRMVLKQNANNTFMAVKDQISKDIGIEPKERKVVVSSHMGARPDHHRWQGKVYLFSELPEKTGYGSLSGLLGINCRHKYYEYIDGISDNNFDSYSSKENDRVYEAQQKLRRMQREIREVKRRELIDKELKGSSAYTKRVTELEGKADVFARQNKISRQKTREKI